MPAQHRAHAVLRNRIRRSAWARRAIVLSMWERSAIAFAHPTRGALLLPLAPRPAPAARAGVEPHLLLVVERGMEGLERRNHDVHRLPQCREPLLQESQPLVRALRNPRRAHAFAQVGGLVNRRLELVERTLLRTGRD